MYTGNNDREQIVPFNRAAIRGMHEYNLHRSRQLISRPPPASGPAPYLIPKQPLILQGALPLEALPLPFEHHPQAPRSQPDGGTPGL